MKILAERQSRSFKSLRRKQILEDRKEILECLKHTSNPVLISLNEWIQKKSLTARQRALLLAIKKKLKLI